MDLAVLSQKVNSWTTVTANWLTNIGNLHFSGTPQDITVKMLDNNGNIIDITIPNVAKFRQQIWDDVGGALGQFGKTVYVDSINGNDLNAGTSNTPFKTMKKAMESAVKGNPINILYMCDDNNNYIYEVDSSIDCYASHININRRVSGTAKMIFKQKINDNEYSFLRCFIPISIGIDSYLTIEIEDKRLGTTPSTLGVIRQYNGKLSFINRGKINLGNSGISLLYGHPADGCTSIEFSTYYNQITTNGIPLIHNNVNTPVILNAPIQLIDNTSAWIKNITRDTNGKPLNVLSNVNFSV